MSKNWDMIRLFESINKTKVKGTLKEDRTTVTNDAGEPMGYETHYDDGRDNNDRTGFDDRDDAPSSSIDRMGFDRIKWEDVYSWLDSNTNRFIHNKNDYEPMSYFGLTHSTTDNDQFMGESDLGLLMHSNLGDWSIGMIDRTSDIKANPKITFNPKFHEQGQYEFPIFEDKIPSYEEFVAAVKIAYAKPSSPNKPDAEEKYRGQF